MPGNLSFIFQNTHPPPERLAWPLRSYHPPNVIKSPNFISPHSCHVSISCIKHILILHNGCPQESPFFQATRQPMPDPSFMTPSKSGLSVITGSSQNIPVKTKLFSTGRKYQAVYSCFLLLSDSSSPYKKIRGNFDKVSPLIFCCLSQFFFQIFLKILISEVLF